MVLQLNFQNDACYIINPAIGGQVMMDISYLAVVGVRLKEAYKGLEHCYGANMERDRVLQGGFCLEIAT